MSASPGYHIFLFDAADAVTRAFWPPRRQGQRPWFLFGGCLFWLVVIYLVAAVYAARIALWAAVLAVLGVAQAVSLLAEVAWRPVIVLRRSRVAARQAAGRPSSRLSR